MAVNSPLKRSIILAGAAMSGLTFWALLRPRPAEALKPLPPLPLRTLIVSGGPSVDYNQYAIESNARYLESLTSSGRGQTILFADGSKKTRTVSTLVHPADYKERQILTWLLDQNPPEDVEVLKSTQLKKLDGPATRQQVLKSLEQFSATIRPGDTGLIYFTGHGDRPGTGPGDPALPSGSNYALWNDESLTVPQVSKSLAKFPPQVPLTLVMVQCHSGGFTDLMFQDANPKMPVLDRDFSGFFAATADRQSSGCTTEVDEVDYQDFTTHFFAALSGQTRYGTDLTGVDYDGDHKVSMLEAYAWAQVHDDSIDVPVCTSDTYLRVLYAKSNNGWLTTPYSRMLKGASPWQKAVLDGLSKKLGLTGEQRFKQAWDVHELVKARTDSTTTAPDADYSDSVRVSAAYDGLQRRLFRAYPSLKKRRSTAAYKAAERKAILWLKRQPAEVKILSAAYDQYGEAAYADEVREAQLWRFLRMGRTLALEGQLAQTGTPAQKSVFARLRRAEGRNPLRP